MRVLRISCVAASLTMAALCAAPGNAGQTNAPPVPTPRDAVPAAGKARVIALVDYTGPAITRAKNVLELTHPERGLYCIKAAVSNTTNSAPIVTVDYDRTFGTGAVAQWGSTGWGCPAGTYAVRTFSYLSGEFDASNFVSFLLVIP